MHSYAHKVKLQFNFSAPGAGARTGSGSSMYVLLHRIQPPPRALANTRPSETGATTTPVSGLTSTLVNGGHNAGLRNWTVVPCACGSSMKQSGIPQFIGLSLLALPASRLTIAVLVATRLASAFAVRR